MASAPLFANSVFFGKRARRHFVQQFRQRDNGLISGDERAGMNILLCLLLDRLHHRRRRVAHGKHPNAAREINQRVAVDVEHQRALSPFHHHIGGASKAGWKGGRTARQQLFRFRSRNLGVQSNIRHGIPSGCLT